MCGHGRAGAAAAGLGATSRARWRWRFPEPNDPHHDTDAPSGDTLRDAVGDRPDECSSANLGAAHPNAEPGPIWHAFACHGDLIAWSDAADLDRHAISNQP
jgi:hypothetical protein